MATDLKSNLTLAGVALAVFAGVFAGGAWYGHEHAMSQFKPVVETARPGKPLPGGGALLPRVPGGKGEIEKPKAPTPGATHIRGSEIAIGGVKPVPKTPVAPGGDGGALKPSCPTADDFVCPEVRVRIDWWEEADGSYGVTAKTDKGEVVGGIDIPGRQPLKFEPKRWAAGVEYEALTGDIAVVVDRDFGPLRIGGAVDVKSEDPGARVQAKWVF